MLWVGVVTLFPEMFAALQNHGVTGRAFIQNKVRLDLQNPREFATPPHRAVDDRPYGGGPGMVMTAPPLAAAIASLQQRAPEQARVLYLSPQGRPLTQNGVQYLATLPSLILLAGRYEGIDERLLITAVDEEWSIGDYVLSGGELPIMVLLDAMIRLQPGVLGHSESANQDSFGPTGLLDCPHYTRPALYAGLPVPAVLQGGDHKAIAKWRLQQALGRTWLRRPDVLAKRGLSCEEQTLLEKFIEENKLL